MLRIRSLVFLLTGFAVLASLQQSCVSHDFPLYTCPDEPVSYTADVHPIVTGKCAISGCHGFNQNLPDWTDFPTFQEGARSGNVRQYVLERIMPPHGSPGGTLTQEEINKIVCWADQGAPNN